MSQACSRTYMHILGDMLGWCTWNSKISSYTKIVEYTLVHEWENNQSCADQRGSMSTIQTCLLNICTHDVNARIRVLFPRAILGCWGIDVRPVDFGSYNVYRQVGRTALITDLPKNVCVLDMNSAFRGDSFRARRHQKTSQKLWAQKNSRLKYIQSIFANSHSFLHFSTVPINLAISRHIPNVTLSVLIHI